MTIIPFEEKKEMALAVSKSGLFGIKSPDQALVLMSICEATGLHPMQACQDYHIINGKPSLTADAMLARFQQSGGKMEWNVYTDTKVQGTFSHPQGGKITVDWTIERARSAGLNSPNWKKFPRNMLRARVASEAIRAILPSIVSGTYTPEEVMDFDSPAPSTPAPSTPAPSPTPKQQPPKQIDAPPKEPQNPRKATKKQIEGFVTTVKKEGLEDFVDSDLDYDSLKDLTKPELNELYKGALVLRDKQDEVEAEVEAEPVEADPAEMMGDRPS